MKVKFLKNESFLSIVLDKNLKVEETAVDFNNNIIKFGFKKENLEYTGYAILKYIKKNNLNKINIITNNDDDLFKILYGFELGNYDFNKYKTEKKEKELIEVNFVAKDVNKIIKKYKDFLIIKDNVFFCRDLVNEPSNIINPDNYASLCSSLSKYGINIEIYNENDLVKLGMKSLLSVGQGSGCKSKLVVLKWNGLDDGFKNPIALVGKGITFDSGGLCLKPSDGMYDMKCDMAGSAVVAATIKLLAERKAKVNAVGVMPIAENMPSGSAIKPGDVVTSMSKQTIEIIDTDAEGRLILADALYYAKTVFNPTVIVDLATLTGACCVALGSKNAGYFTNNNELAKELGEASKDSGEHLWRLPLDELGGTYDKMMDSEIADVKNLSGVRLAGSITAAQFLQRFIDGHKKWVHIDIAGTAFLNPPELYAAKETYTVSGGATGYGVRLLNSLIKNNYEKK